MSNRLAISATLSILMMAIYVVLGAGPAPFSSRSHSSPVSIAAPAISLEAGELRR